MKIRSAALAAGLLAGAVLQAHAQAVQLRFSPPVGQVTHYRMTTRTWSSSDTTGTPVAQVATYQTQTVMGMDSGAYTVKTVMDSTVMNGGGGRGGDPMRGMAFIMRMDPRGHVLSTQVTPPPGMPSFLGNMLTKNAHPSDTHRVWPEGTINPGDTWTDSMTMSTGNGRRAQPVVFRVTYKYERLEHQGADRVVVISMNGNPTGTEGATLTGLMAADIDAGRLMHMTSDMVSGQSRSLTTMEMVP